MTSPEIRTVVATMLAESHMAQAQSLKEWLDCATYADRSAKDVLWRTYFAHIAAAERLLERVTGVEGRIVPLLPDDAGSVTVRGDAV